jgi:hypothetical protein
VSCTVVLATIKFYNDLDTCGILTAPTGRMIASELPSAKTRCNISLTSQEMHGGKRAHMSEEQIHDTIAFAHGKPDGA